MIFFFVAIIAFTIFRGTAGDTDRFCQYIGRGCLIVFGLCWLVIGVRCLMVDSGAIVPGLILTPFGLWVLWHCSVGVREIQKREGRR